jgi:2-oxo-3-hexenedioate decarboxylase
MEMQKKLEVARQLTEARLFKRSLQQWSQARVQMNRLEAYEIQELGIQHRLNLSEVRIGYKMGLTSEGKRKQMNLDSPLYGELTNKMQVLNSTIFDITPLIHPKIEPEVAFKIKSTLKGKVDYATVIANITHVCATMEILDSRYTQFKYFSMDDVIADNSSSSHFVLGNWVPFESEKMLENARLEMYVNDTLSQAGDAKEISGDPILSVVQLCELLQGSGRSLEAGSIVLAGAATPAIELKPNQKIELKITGQIAGRIADKTTTTKLNLPSAVVHIKGN